MSGTPPIVAVVGGGQLARMMAEPAAALGIPLRLLAESEDSAAAQVIVDHRVGDYRELDDLLAITKGCAVVTFDHEHVPTDHLHSLEEHLPVRPGPTALEHAQDKGLMRERLDFLGIPSPRHAIVASPADVEAFGLPCVLKATRGGYDGKGVWFAYTLEDTAEALAGDQPVLAEEFVDFRRELSALIARSPSGETVVYPVVESTQDGGICREVIAPAPDLAPELATQAQAIAKTIAESLDVTGVLAVELFETTDGRVLVNELAMRPHNTGHWTQDGAITSQFENHLRAVLDLPLGSAEARTPWTVMVNILPVEGAKPLHSHYVASMSRDPALKVHLYGKEVRAGRKVGHVNTYGTDLADCLDRARRAAAWFAGELDGENVNRD